MPLAAGVGRAPPESVSIARPSRQPFGGPHEITLDLSNSDFLIVYKHPGEMAPQFKHYIPWEKIIDIVFVEPSSYYSTRSSQ